jgi:hypothetical protein
VRQAEAHRLKVLLHGSHRPVVGDAPAGRSAMQMVVLSWWPSGEALKQNQAGRQQDTHSLYTSMAQRPCLTHRCSQHSAYACQKTLLCVQQPYGMPAHPSCMSMTSSNGPITSGGGCSSEISTLLCSAPTTCLKKLVILYSVAESRPAQNQQEQGRHGQDSGWLSIIPA